MDLVKKIGVKSSFLVLSFLSIQLIAQTKIDTLKQLLPAQNGEEKLTSLLTLSQLNLYTDSKQSKDYAEKALALAQQLGNDDKKATAYYFLGFSKYRLGSYTDALNDLRIAEDGFINLNNLYSSAMVKNLIAIINYYIGRYEISAKLYSQNLVYYKARNMNKDYCKMLINLATVYSQRGDYDKALTNLHEAKSYMEKYEPDNSYIIGNTNANIGDAYSGKREFKLALKNYFAALSYLEKANDVDGIANLEMNAGSAYLELKNFPQSKKYFDLALKSFTQLKYTKGIMNVMENIVQYYEAVGQPDKALKENSRLESLCVNSKDTVMLAKCLKHYAYIYETKHEYSVSTQYFKKYFTLKNVIEKMDNRQSMIGLQVLTDAEEKEMENMTLKQENELQKERLKRSLLIFYFVFAGLILISVFLFILYKKEKNIRKYAALLENKNEEIKIQNDKLEEVILAKDKLFSIIAHDLRSPFTGLLGLTEILTENINGFNSEELLATVKKLYTNLTNLYTLLKNLLDWAQMQQKNLPINRKEIDLLKTLELNINLISSFAEQKDIKVKCNIPSNQKILADEAMLNSIISNLLSNSIKFTKRGGTVSVDSKITPSNYLEVAITDTGIGMPESLVNKLFKINEKVGRSGTEGEKSTGLGLILCKELVEKNGGTIRVESDEYIGSTFYFSIPLVVQN